MDLLHPEMYTGDEPRSDSNAPRRARPRHYEVVMRTRYKRYMELRQMRKRWKTLGRKHRGLERLLYRNPHLKEVAYG